MALVKNQVSDITPLAGLANLTLLNAAVNQISDLSPLRGLANLSSVYLQHNQISDISALAYLPNLQVLGIGWNPIGDLSVLGMLTNLRWLDVGGMQMGDLSALAGLTSLEDLQAPNNQITDLSPLGGLVNLKHLTLLWNDISNIAPLAPLANLETIDLTYNHVADLSPLGGKTGLTTLQLEHNEIGDLSFLAGFTRLEILWVQWNPLNNGAYCVYLPLIKVNNPSLDLPLLSNDPVPPTRLSYSPNTNAPAGVLASDGLYPDKVQITWEGKCTGPNYTTTFYYRVYRGTSATVGRTTVALGNWQTETSFDDASALPGITYHYWVTSATDASGSDQTAYSEPDTGFLMGPTLIVSSTRGGHASIPGEGTFHYVSSTSVQIAAAAKPNFHFDRWTGTAVNANKVADANAAQTTVAVDSNDTLVANFVSESDTLYVDRSGSADPNVAGTQSHPFGGIQETIEVAAPDSRVVIAAGTYAGPLDLLGKRIKLTGPSLTDPNHESWPVIDAQGKGPVVTFTHGEDSSCVLRSLVLTGGKAGKAGAIYCSGSSPSISNCLIVGNRVIEPNAGVVYCKDSNAAILNCTIADNYAGPGGAGVYLFDSPVLIRNSIIRGNGPVDLTVADGLEPVVTYSDVGGGWPGTGNTALDPLFASPGHWTDPGDPNAQWVPGDYHLMSAAGRWDPTTMTWVPDTVTSPCIDAGDPLADWSVEPLPNGNRVNLGAYGGTSQASHSPQ